MSNLTAEQFESKLQEMETEVGIQPQADSVVETPVEEPKEEAKVEEPKKEEIVEEKEVKDEVKAETAAYVPNLKFNVKNKEHEIDPIFKPIITSKEVEDKVRELHAKAYGIEEVQKSRDNWRGQYEESKKELDVIAPSKALYQRGQEFIEKGDMESAIQCITASIKGVFTEDEILAAANLIADTKLNPQNKGRIERELRHHEESIKFSREKQTIEQQRLEIEAEQVQKELDYMFKQPQVTTVQAVYDKIHGQGKFFEKVKNHGHSMTLATGKTYPVSNAIEDMVKEYTPFVNSMSKTTNEAGTQQVPVTQKVIQPNNTAKIPNVRATASAGKKSSVSSMADLDSRIAAMEAEL